MKTNPKLIIPLLMVVIAFGSCDEKKPDDPCILSVSLKSTFGTGTVELTALPADGLAPYEYHWSNNQLLSSVIVTLPSSGAVAVTVTDALACTATATYTFPCRNETSATDIDGNQYPITAIGNQCWMTENLRDTFAVPEVTDNTAWINATTPAWCYYNNTLPSYTALGKLYNWYAVIEGSLCPSGWHVPTDEEWQELITFLGGDTVAGGKMKSVDGWNTPNTGASADGSGFNAMGSGYRKNTDGSFSEYKGETGFWSSTESGNTVWRTILYNNSASAYRNESTSKNEGYPCRCIKNVTTDPCANIVCQNGGTCASGNCNCPPGFTGTFCETLVPDPCGSITCQNGGTCSNGICNCPPGYLGFYCEMRDCDSVVCQNGGTCNHGICNCPPGYSGINCENPPPKKVHIDSIKVISFPAKTTSGNDWDNDGTGPDLRLSIDTGFSPQDTTFVAQQFPNQTTVPFTFNSSVGLPYTISKINSYNVIGLWDDDSPNAGPHVSRQFFIPISGSQVIGSTTYYFDTVRVQNFFLYVRWEY